MTKTDQTAIREGVRAILNRREAAFQDFVSLLADPRYVGDLATARKVANLYLQLKAIKYDGMRYTVKHGGFLDRAVLLRAAQTEG